MRYHRVRKVAALMWRVKWPPTSICELPVYHFIISVASSLYDDACTYRSMVVKNEFWLVKSAILRVKMHKTCKIGFKTRKPVKSVKPGQTRIKSGQPVKNVKTGPISRFHVKCKTCALCWLSTPFSQSPPHARSTRIGIVQVE